MWLRVSILLFVLVVIGSWAWSVHRSREARTEWKHPLKVAIVLLEKGSVEASVVERLKERTPVLESELRDEFERYRDQSMTPFRFEIVGPTSVDEGPPLPPRTDALTARIEHAVELYSYLWDIHGAVGLDAGDYDSRIYLTISPPAGEKSRRFFEGAGAQGGEVGMVEIDLAEDTVDNALITATHELFHTLGATDKYDASGGTEIPAGLAEPNRRPQFPQAKVDVMARQIPQSPRRGVLPDTLEQLGVGPATAAEIKWRAD